MCNVKTEKFFICTHLKGASNGIFAYSMSPLAMANLRYLRNDYIRFSSLFSPQKRSFLFSFFLFYTITNEDVRFASIL